MDWTDREWLAGVEAWVGQVLGREGIEVVGGFEQPHVREWGTVLRVPTSVGDVYFKAALKELLNEAAVTQALSAWHPELQPRFIAADVERNWMLVGDGGLRLRDAFGDGLGIETWSAVLASYAAFQIDLSARVDELLALGIPDRRLEKIPELFEALLADKDWMMIGEENGLTAEEYDRLVAGRPLIEELCRELAAFEIPDSLNQGDLHDGNIFLKDGRHLFFDWGDSSITHPFFTLRAVFVSMEYTFEYEENDPRFDHFARDYVKPWQSYSDQASLWKAYLLASRLWSIPSVLQWKHVMSHLPELRARMNYAVPSLLQEVLESNPEM
jgi:hypothetical protein